MNFFCAWEVRKEKKNPEKFKISQKCSTKLHSLNDYILATAHNFLSAYAIYKLSIFKHTLVLFLSLMYFEYFIISLHTIIMY